MDARKVFVAMVLIATFALPSLAHLEKDFIARETVHAVLKKINSNALPSEEVISALTGKTLVSSIVLQEAFLKNLDGLKSTTMCYETCMLLPCVSAVFGCYCSGNGCWKDV